MENRTISHYLTFALKKLDPPADWEDILKFVLTTLNSTWRRKYYTKELRKALEVGLRFGIIREMKSKYYLYEYAEINSFGEISYEFTDNPLSILRIKNEGEKDDEKEQDDGKEKDEDESCSEQNDIVFNLEKESGHTSVRTDLQESDRTTLEKKTKLNSHDSKLND